jgi:tetratricopeptide (TPR) repeat protein
MARRPRDHNTYFRLPEMAMYLNELGEDTRAAIKQLEYIQPYHEKVFYLWGDYYRKTGDLDRAVASYRRAIELEPRYFRARLFLVDTLIKSNRIDEAKAAIKAAWLWLPESETRLGLTRRRSARVKLAGDVPLAQPDDLYWSWVINAEATVLALEGDFDAARRRWADARAEWLAVRIPMDPFEQGAFGIFPEPPTFLLNPKLLDTTTPQAVTSNRAQWATRFAGLSDYERLKPFEDRYAQYALAGPVVSALDVLDSLVHEFGEDVLISGENWAGEYHNRRGVLLHAEGDDSKAAAEFELSAKKLGALAQQAGMTGPDRPDDTARANRVALERRDLRLPIIDEWSFAQLRRLVLVVPFQELFQSPIIRSRTTQEILGRADSYPHFPPAVLRAAVILVRAGQPQAARERLLQLKAFYPEDDRPDGMRETLGL